MAFDGSAVSVATTATALHTFTAENQSVAVYNNGSATIYIGNASDTTSTGFPIAPGATFTTGGLAGEVLYGIVASSTVEARVLKQGV